METTTTQTYPYNDDFMVYNERTNHYVLTEEALIDAGYDLRSQITNAGVINPEKVINGFLKTVSDMVYAYIHRFSARNSFQDNLIATVPDLRPIIYEAMKYQAVYVYFNGNLTLSVKREERENAFDMTCIDILNTVIPCIGTSILYTGVL